MPKKPHKRRYFTHLFDFFQEKLQKNSFLFVFAEQQSSTTLAVFAKLLLVTDNHSDDGCSPSPGGGQVSRAPRRQERRRSGRLRPHCGRLILLPLPRLRRPYLRARDMA